MSKLKKFIDNKEESPRGTVKDRNRSRDKVTDLKTAVANYVHDGCSLCLGSAIAREPMAVAREIIRQGKKDLTLIETAKTSSGEILVGMGCLKKIEIAYFWIGVIGQGYNFRRAIEKGVPLKPELEEYSMLSSSLRLLAGSMKVPFLPTKSLIGSDLPKVNPKIKIIDDPYTGEKIALVPAINPEVTFIHVQKCDPLGNAVILGNLWNDSTSARAAICTVLTCEEIISEEEIRRNPNMTAIPHYCVDAVVHLPFGAHPEPVDGYYWMDQPFRKNFVELSKTREGFLQWIDDWVYGCEENDQYLNKLGRDRLDALRDLEQKYRQGMTGP